MKVGRCSRHVQGGQPKGRIDKKRGGRGRGLGVWWRARQPAKASVVGWCVRGAVQKKYERKRGARGGAVLAGCCVYKWVSVGVPGGGGCRV